MTGLIPKPIPNPKSKATAPEESSKTAVTSDDYQECLEEWKSIQSKILSWFINTSIPSIHNLLPRFETIETAVCPSDPSVPTGPSLASSLITTDIEVVVQ